MAFFCGSGACGKTPTAVSGGAPSAALPDASAAIVPSSSDAPSAPAPSSTERNAKRPAGCWSNVSAPDAGARLSALGQRCANGFRVLVPSTPVKAGGNVEAVLPPNTCARVVVVGQKASARLEHPDGTVFARSAGEADAVLPEGGPFCTAKGQSVKVVVGGADASVVVHASP